MKTNRLWLLFPSTLLAFACSSAPNVTDGGGDSCPVPHTACGQACTDLQSDPMNCGACGVTCDTAHAEVCSQGKCSLACGGGTTKCGSACMDLQNDEKNCGACGKACGQGEQCAMGACQAACAMGATLCSSKSGAVCVDVQSDTQNCGKCGTACGANDSCVAGACVANLYTLGSVQIQGALTGCANGAANIHKLAIDARHGLHALLSCNGDLHYVASKDGGLTYVKPLPTGLTATQYATMSIANDGRIHVLAVKGGALLYSSSTDGGTSWSMPQTIEQNLASPIYGLSIATYKGSAWLHVANGTAHVWRPTNNGYQMASVPSMFPSSLLVDPSNGDLFLAGDNGTISIAHSTDGGATFPTDVSTTIANVYTDAVFSKGNILTAGLQPHFEVFPASTPTMHTTITGFDGLNGPSRALAVDSAGNAYVASQLGTGEALLQRVLANGTMIESKRSLDTGIGGIQIAATDNAAFITYGKNGGIWATVQTY